MSRVEKLDSEFLAKTGANGQSWRSDADGSSARVSNCNELVLEEQNLVYRFLQEHVRIVQMVRSVILRFKCMAQ